MNKKILAIAIVLAVIAGAFIASNASAVNPGNYTLNVTGGQNTALTTIDTSFDNVLAGATSTINPTFNATNSGNVAANVSVRFIANGTIFGFNGSTSNITGNYTDMQHDALGWQELKSTDEDTNLTNTIAPDNVSDNFGIRVRVPAGQTAEAYVATIAVTFSDGT